MKQLHFGSLSGLVVLMASTAYAQDGIPQMDQTWYANQLLWLAISFALLYAVVSCFIAPRISGMLTTRETAIAEAIAEAQTAKRAAQTASGDVAVTSQSARMRAAEIMAAAQAAHAQEAAEAVAKLDHTLEREAGHAHHLLAEAVTKARATLHDAAEDIARAMAEKLLAGSSAAAGDASLTLKP